METIVVVRPKMDETMFLICAKPKSSFRTRLDSHFWVPRNWLVFLLVPECHIGANLVGALAPASTPTTLRVSIPTNQSIIIFVLV